MQPIIPTIHPGETGPHVANLQDALIALLGLTPEELETLSVDIRRERARSTFGEATYKLVITFQVQQVLNDNLCGVVEDTTAAKLNELLKFFGVLDEDTSLIVRGTVQTANGQLIRGAIVHAFDRDMRKEQPLGDPAETNDRGEYVIRYSVADFSSGDVPSAPTPKLIVRAFEGDRQIGADVSRPHPTRDEVVDFKASAPVVSEWEKLTTGIMPLLEGQGEGDQALPPWDLNDGDMNPIAEETGLEREKIRLWALAFTVGRHAAVGMQAVPLTSKASDGRSNVVVADDLSGFAVFYGWFRLGLPTEPSALWLTPTDKLLATVRTAIAQDIVPSNIDVDRDGLSTRIEHSKLDRVLQAPALGTRASLGDLLATLPTLLNLDQQRAIAAATDLQPDDQLVERIKRIPGFDDDALAVGVTHTLRLGALTAGHLPLAQALQVRLQHAEENKGTLLPLAALRPDEWIDLAYTHGTPDGITITPVAYADALAASVEQQYPTAALAAHLSDGRRLARQPMLADVGTFLRDNHDFDIEATNLNAYTKKAKFGGIAEPKQEQLVSGLRAIQRMRLLTANLDETATLFENDLYSPHQLLAAGPGQLTTLLDGQIAPERVAALYSQAEELHTVTLGAFTAALSPLSGPRIMPNGFGIPGGGDPINPDDLGVVGPGTILPKPFPEDDGSGGSTVLKEEKDLLASGRTIDPRRALILHEIERPVFTPVFRAEAHWTGGGMSVLDRNPTLQTLFGSQDACACGHCSSVLGPAAYFVDVLQFINEANLLNRLLERRPDLQDLELSCNNTKTVVPAIDLALEILENAVALPLDVLLPADTNVDEQLVSGQPVGAAVRDALAKTVRNLVGEVRATREGGAWTVVDGHRRWKLTAHHEGLWLVGTWEPWLVDTKGVNLQALMAALDEGDVSSDAEALFARLFVPNHIQPPDLTNYTKTITPLITGMVKSWRIEYQYKAQVLTNQVPLIVIQTSEGVGWWKEPCDQATIAAIEDDLSSGIVPALVQGLLASRFYSTSSFIVTPTGTDTWTIASAKRELTLRHTPARLSITSLAYQSGDANADAIAEPENHNPEAYVRLKNKKATFPWSLPVDLPLEEVRLFLERARSSRRRLIELMLPVDDRLLDDTAVTVPAAQSTREDTPLVFSQANRNAITLPDVRGRNIQSATVSVTKGELKIGVHSEVKIHNNNTNSVAIQGNSSAITNALDGMIFTPSLDYNGAATLTIASTEEPGIVVVSVPITITPMVDIAGDTAATEEDAPIIIPVLANDTFENIGHSITLVDGLAITADGPAVNVTHGTVALDVSGRLIFTPARNYNGPAAFTYTVSSGGVMESATVHVAVNSANLASFALEVLGLSKAEAELIAPSSPPSDADIYSYWGLSRTATTIFDAASGRTLEGTSPRALLQNVAIMLQQSRLSFEELQAVLEARFVAQDGKAPLRIEPQTTCKPSEMWLPTLTAGHLDRIHRFARLWRKLGWTMRDLDLAIQAFGGQLTPETLISLSRLQRLREQLELPVASLVGGLHLLETQPWTDHLTEGAPVHPSLYATIFQREAVRAVSDFADFALQSDGKELKNTPIRGISVHAIYIGACLRIKASVVADWVSGTDGLGIVDKLDLANLSRLTAAADLCRALGIDPKNFAQHLKLYGAPIFPFQSGLSAHDRAEAMLKFVERFRFVEQSGVDAETLCYLLKHEITPGSNIHIDAKRLKQLASAARDAVRSILDAPVKIHTLPLTQAEAEADHNEAAEAARAIRLAREDAAIAALATGLDGARELVDELLRKRLRHPSDPVQWGIDALLAPAFTTSDVAHSPTAAAPPNAVLDPVVKTKVDAADKAVEHVLVRLHKTLLICDALKLSRTDLSLLRASTTDPHGFTVLDFNSLPVASGDAPTSITGFEQLLALTQLRGLASNAGDLLHEYATLTFPSNLPVVWKERVVVLGGEEIRIPESAPVRWHPGAAHQVLTTGLTLTQAEVQAAAQQLRITTAEQYRNPITLTRLINLLIALKQLGATVEQARDLTAPSPSDAAAIGARELLHGKYGVSQWHNLIKPIADKLRERQRNALVDFLVAHKGLRGADDLYERYLIDVQTGSCLKTTRLLQATAAAQLFVQRVLLNLEDGASLSDDKRNRWEWMRSYRVWEANRKVFLFPENWLLTDLRDDKTATFRQMESALIEQESSPEITRAALLGYLEELSDLAQISVIAMYQDQRIVEQDEAGNDTVEYTLYVIGRTPDQPYRYFWRSCTNFGSDKMSWSGWEALDLDNGNDFIMPFVFEGDLHVAWPIFRKTKDDNDKLLWEVQLAWTRRTNKGWIKRKIGHAQLRVNRLENIEAPASFAFRFGKEVFLVPGSAIQRESIIINCYAAIDNTPTSLKPDPSLLENTVPDGYEPVVEEYWNVNCDVRGVVYHWATINNQGGKFYQGIGNVRVDAHTRRHDSDGGGGNNIYLNPSVTTDPDGNFSFNFTAKVPVPGDLKNGAPGMGTGTGYGVENSYSITLTFYIRGHRPVTRTCRLLKNGNERYLYWTWNINYGVENQELAEIFRADRKVTYQSTGLFIFETGKDLRFDPSTEGALLPGPVPSLGLTIVSPLIFSVSPTSYSNEQRDMPVDGNRFVAKKTKDVHSIDSIALGAEGTLVLTPTITFPVFVTHATQGQAPGTTPESPVWYLQDNNGSSYLQKRDDTWHRWADGQAFASSYRTAATPSTTRLFSMEVQTALVDPIADNFLRPAPYANYNWELFLHAPLAIADYLARQQRFADARHWLHCVFDPTRPLFEGLTQFWRFLPFKNATTPDSISKLLTWLANPSVLTAEARAKFQADFGHQIDEWKKNPFMPHVIARLRPSAYQWHTFFAYLEVLIGWGDQLFRRDTRESVNEATLLYVLAAKLLGARPRVIPPPTPPPPRRIDRSGQTSLMSSAMLGFTMPTTLLSGDSLVHRRAVCVPARVLHLRNPVSWVITCPFRAKTNRESLSSHHSAHSPSAFHRTKK